jgi:hypothetical protein
MVTLIGTPPNIIIASIREDALGAPFAMFDFAPVGAVTALAGWSSWPDRLAADPEARFRRRAATAGRTRALHRRAARARGLAS